MVGHCLDLVLPNLGVLGNSPLTQNLSDGLGLDTTAPFNGFIRIFTEFDHFSTIDLPYYMLFREIYQFRFWEKDPFCVLYIGKHYI